MTQPGTVFNIKQGDRSPAISEVLYNAPVAPATTPLPVDLTDVQGVRFHLIDINGAVVINQPAIVVDTAGVVTYLWGPTDTATSGDFWREWEVTLASGNKVTIPNDRRGYVVHIEKQGA